MSLLSLLFASLLLLLAKNNVVNGQSSRPGQCSSSKPCPAGEGTCISVKTEIAGIEDASQCTLDPVCSGNEPGACPTFSAWTRVYQNIQPICGFFKPENCKTGSNKLDEDTVDCFNLTVTFGEFNNETLSVLGIYGCEDRKVYEERNGGYVQTLTDSQIEACGGKDDDSMLCNGQGTCAAVGSLNSNYTCICNAGFSTEDKCLEPTSNECNSAGQCGAGGNCDIASQRCQCVDEVGGFQCSECTTDQSCGGVDTGSCGADNKCTCKEGFTGAFCNGATALPNDDGAASSYQPNATTIFLSTLFGLFFVTLA